ncbi:hypothetical protein ACFE04_003219 [Oxalis oulophora]
MDNYLVNLVISSQLFPLRRKNLPPSPLSLPILGHLHLVKPPLHRFLHSLSLKHGPIFSLRLGSRLVFVVSSPSIAKECFSTENDVVLANRPDFISLSKHLTNFSTVATAPYGDHWRNLRRILAVEVLSSSRLNMSFEIRKDEIDRLLIKLARVSSNGFAKVELKSLFQELAFNIILRIIAGKRYYGEDVSDEEQAESFRKIIKELISYAGASNLNDFLPIMNWIDGGAHEKRVIELCKNVNAILLGLIEEHRTKKDGNGIESFNTMVDHLLSFQESQPDYYNDQTIKGLMQVIIFAATDTTSVTLEWAMSCLLNHKNILNKLKSEINLEVGDGKLLDESDTAKLPYLQNVISETLRLYPPAPLLSPHFSSDECKIGGYDMPPKTMLLVNAWSIHRDPSSWKDAESFRPERFENVKTEDHMFLPFGMGRRSCPGVSLANRVMRLTLGLLIQCFEWERIGDEEIDMTEDRGITIPKLVPLEAMCKARPIVNKHFSLNM